MIQCSHQHNEEDEGLDGDCLMMDCYDSLSVSDLFGPVWTKDTHSQYGP